MTTLLGQLLLWQALSYLFTRMTLFNAPNSLIVWGEAKLLSKGTRRGGGRAGICTCFRSAPEPAFPLRFAAFVAKASRAMEHCPWETDRCTLGWVNSSSSPLP